MDASKYNNLDCTQLCDCGYGTNKYSDMTAHNATHDNGCDANNQTFMSLQNFFEGLADSDGDDGEMDEEVSVQKKTITDPFKRQFQPHAAAAKHEPMSHNQTNVQKIQLRFL